ncbi:hypothetical protein WJX79_006728 [Trebouxia sp. C0005]
MKLDVRRLIEAEYKTASVSDVTDYWMFVAESLQHELHSLIQPKAAARQCFEALNRRSSDLKDPLCRLCSFLDPKHKVLTEDGEEESLLR